MITIEVYRPDEMSMASFPVAMKPAGRLMHKNRRPRKESQEFSDYEEPLVAEQTDDIFTMQRGKSNSVYMPDNNKIDMVADQKISNPLFISFIGKKADARKILEDTQLNQMKAAKEVKNFLLANEDKSGIEDSASSINSEVDEELKGSYKNMSHQGKSSDDERVSEPDDSSKEPEAKSMKAHTGQNFTNQNNSTDEFVRNDSTRRKSETSKFYARNDLNELLSQKKEEEISVFRDKKLKSELQERKSPTNFLFKETFEQQSERLRKASIFGTLKTWKLLKIIVKSGDDLRQEQFAMQLIESMNQIFKANDIE